MYMSNVDESHDEAVDEDVEGLWAKSAESVSSVCFMYLFRDR